MKRLKEYIRITWNIRERKRRNMEMTGICKFCGQARMVEAATQEEADRIAAENCACDNNLKNIRKLNETSILSAERQLKTSAWIL